MSDGTGVAGAVVGDAVVGAAEGAAEVAVAETEPAATGVPEAAP